MRLRAVPQNETQTPEPPLYQATNFTLKEYVEATGLQSCVAGEYVESRAIPTATTSSAGLPLLCETAAPVTVPRASSFTSTSVVPLVPSARAATGISGGGGVLSTTASMSLFRHGFGVPVGAAVGSGVGGVVACALPPCPPADCVACVARGKGRDVGAG